MPANQTEKSVDVSALLVARRAQSGQVTQEEARAALWRLSVSAPVTRALVYREVARVQARCPSGNRQDRLAALGDLVGERLHRMIVGTGGKPAVLDLDRVTAGVHLTSWLRAVLLGVLPCLVARVLRDEARLPVAISDERLADAVDGGGLRLLPPRRETTDRGPLAEQLLRGLQAQSHHLLGSSRTLAQASCLIQALGLPELDRPHFDDPSQRRRFLDWVGRGDGQPRGVLRDLLRATAEPGAAHVRVVSGMVSRLTMGELRHLLSQQDHVIQHLLRAAAVPRPLPRQSVLREMSDRVYKDCGRKPRVIRALVDAWAPTVADLTVSEHRAGGAREKTPAQRACDQESFAAAVARANVAGVTLLGDTPDQVSVALSALLERVEAQRGSSQMRV